jgi:hypothetical protein
LWNDAESLSMLRGLRTATPPPASGLSIEVIYGHAWCPAVKRRQDGLATVQFHRTGSKL